MFKNMEHERKRVEYMRTEKGQQSIPETMFNDFTSPIGTKNLNTKKDQQDYFTGLRERRLAMEAKMAASKAVLVSTDRTNDTDKGRPEKLPKSILKSKQEAYTR
jgi:hypothetical protein